MKRTLRRSRANAAIALAAITLAASLDAAPAAAQRLPERVQRGFDPPPDIPAPLLCPCTTAAPRSEPSEGPLTAEEKLAEAKRLFQSGNALRRANQLERALDDYMRSRALVPSKPNTLNAAFCLEQLGRSDEAYDMYSALLGERGDELSEDERRDIAATLTRLKRGLGGLRVSTNVDAALVIDGRLRGRLPLSSDVRVLAGDHVVRIVKDGWQTFETNVKVEANETVLVDAHLTALIESGRMRVEDDRLVGADLFVDGAIVGQLPWEGTLAPGVHFYSVRKGDIGSAPREANVIAGRTVALTVEAGPLGGELRVVAQPITADLALNGVPVGKGMWRGRLPIGKHTFEVHEPGYLPYTARPVIGPETRGDLVIRLIVDESHPRWGIRRGAFWAEVWGGPSLASGLGSGAERTCGVLATCAPRSAVPAIGGLLSLSVGYELPLRLSPMFSVGYVSFESSLERTFTTTFTRKDVPMTFTVNDALTLQGPFVGVGARYKYEITGGIYVKGGISVAAAFAEAVDDVRVRAEVKGESAEMAVQGGGRPLRTFVPFFLPELGVGLDWGRFYADLGLAALLVPVGGPPHETRENYFIAGSRGPCTLERRGTIDCAPERRAVSEEDAFGPFAGFVPRASVGLRF